MRAPGSPGDAARPTVNVLMYHSIADGAGPTSIPPAVFASQMAALARSECEVVTLGQVAAWLAGTGSIPDRAVAITFDDGFADFIPAARILGTHGFPSTMFLPTGCMGGMENWAGADVPPRAIMAWADAKALMADGVEFGGHTISHPDLTTLEAEAVEHEISTCRDDIETHLGVTPHAFAAPYGAANAAVRAVVGRHFATAVSTELARPSVGGNVLDVPRIEMFYFRDTGRWEAYLDGRGESYLRVRTAIRRVRQILK